MSSLVWWGKFKSETLQGPDNLQKKYWGKIFAVLSTRDSRTRSRKCSIFSMAKFLQLVKKIGLVGLLGNLLSGQVKKLKREDIRKDDPENLQFVSQAKILQLVKKIGLVGLLGNLLSGQVKN